MEKLNQMLKNLGENVPKNSESSSPNAASPILKSGKVESNHSYMPKLSQNLVSSNSRIQQSQGGPRKILHESSNKTNYLQ